MMARGKYANRTEAAKARETAQEEAVRLRRDVARLTKENEALQGALNDTLGTMHAETARLRSLVIKGSSEELERAQSTATQFQKERDRKEARFKGLLRFQASWVRRFTIYVMEAERLTYAEARARVSEMMPPVPKSIEDVALSENPGIEKVAVEAVVNAMRSR